MRQAAKRTIQRKILLRRDRPAEVFTHTAQHKPPPHGFIGRIVSHGAFQRKQHFVRVIICKRKPVALVRIFVIGTNAVAQTARLAHDRYGAVAQRDHLRQAAGLKLRRHQEQIAARINTVRQPLVQSDVRADLPFIAPCRPVDEIDISFVAAAQEHDLNIHAHNVRQHALDQIKALLRREPRNHADHRGIGSFCKPEFTLQRTFADRLALRLRSIKRCGKVWVGSRIVGLGIDTVQNAGNRISAHPEQAVEPFAVIVRLDLLRIGGTDGRNMIRKHDPRLHAGKAAVKLQIIRRKQAFGQAEPRVHVRPVENALITQVMNGKHRADVAHPLIPLVLCPKERRDQSRLPVV